MAQISMLDANRLGGALAAARDTAVTSVRRAQRRTREAIANLDRAADSAASLCLR